MPAELCPLLQERVTQISPSISSFCSEKQSPELYTLTNPVNAAASQPWEKPVSTKLKLKDKHVRENAEQLLLLPSPLLTACPAAVHPRAALSLC